MRKILLFLLVLCGCFPLWSTEQVWDHVKYGGVDFLLGKDEKSASGIKTTWVFPLEEYFKSKKTSGYNVFEEYAIGNSPACWRGYIGQWHVKGNRLLLLNVSLYPMYDELEKRAEKDDRIRKYIDAHKRSMPKNLLDVANKGWESPVFAEWYSGDIVLTIPYSPIVVARMTINAGIAEDITHLNAWIVPAIPSMENMFNRIREENLQDPKTRKDKPFFLADIDKVNEFAKAWSKINAGMNSSEVEAVLKEVSEGMPAGRSVDAGGNKERFIRYYLLQQNKDFSSPDAKDISVEFIFKLNEKNGKDVLWKMVINMKEPAN